MANAVVGVWKAVQYQIGRLQNGWRAVGAGQERLDPESRMEEEALHFLRACPSSTGAGSLRVKRMGP